MPAYQFLKSLTRSYMARGPPPNERYEDPRNENILAYVGTKGEMQGCIVPRDMAGVSPWDSSVQGGDAAWEGLRVYRGKILCLEKHLRRLQKSCKALGFEDMFTNDEIKVAIFKVLAANGMRDGVHIRLTVTRGEKCTSSMNPKFNIYGRTLIILPEWKATEVSEHRLFLLPECLHLLHLLWRQCTKHLNLHHYFLSTLLGSDDIRQYKRNQAHISKSTQEFSSHSRFQDSSQQYDQ